MEADQIQARSFNCYKTNENCNPRIYNYIPEVYPELALSVEAAVVVPDPVEVPYRTDHRARIGSKLE